MKVIAGLGLILIASCVWGLPQPLSHLPILDGRIVGGRDVSIEDYPYQVSVLLLGSHICGGFIISQNWVVSAAHCYLLPIVSWHSIRAGSSIRNSGGVVHSLTSWTDHPSYTHWLYGYDISLLQLSSSLSLGPSIATIALPSRGEDAPSGSIAVVTGWGYTVENGSLADQLQAVEVPIITNEECAAAYGERYGPFITATDSMLCAGFVGVGERDACDGDSGGPLAWNGVAVGVVSWGQGCARPFAPGVYARVSYLRDWIREVSGI